MGHGVLLRAFWSKGLSQFIHDKELRLLVMSKYDRPVGRAGVEMPEFPYDMDYTPLSCRALGRRAVGLLLHICRTPVYIDEWRTAVRPRRGGRRDPARVFDGE